MRMSMAKKLYAIVALLLIVAIIILGIGIYSMTSMTNTMHNVIRQANRLTNVGNVESIALRRRIAVVDVINSGVEANMKALMDGDVKATETNMEAELQAYRANFDSPPSSTQLEYEKTLRQFWGEYVVASAEVADLAYQNTNNKALRQNTDMTEFWNYVDATFGEVAQLLVKDGKHPDVLTHVMSLRSSSRQFCILLLRYIPETNTDAAAAYLREIRSIVSLIDQTLNTLIAEMTPETGLNQIQALAKRYFDEATPKINAILSLVEQNTNVRAGRLLAERATPVRERLESQVAAIVANGRNLMAAAETGADELSRNMLLLMSVIGAAGIVLAIIISYMTVSGITRRLNSIIASLGESSSQVKSASSQISTSSQNLAEGTTEQAASLEETSSALEQMASMTRQNADNATKTNETTQNNNRQISEGSDAVKNMSQAMAEISDSAEQINRIIKTIEDIAFQTNLLALNAAVEAARAGEAGKGFAVVADEVRNLAGRSAQAARDTTQLIHTTIERVRNGSEIAGRLDSSFKIIEDGSNLVARLISEITNATNEQAQGVDQVNTAVAQMDKVVQESAATAEEAASAAEELSAQAEGLNGMVDELIGMVEGRGGSGAVPGMARQQHAPARRAARQAPRLETSAPAPRAVKEMKVLQANDVIPLDENDDF